MSLEGLLLPSELLFLVYINEKLEQASQVLDFMDRRKEIYTENI